MNGSSLIAQLKRKLRASTDASLARKLGISLPGLNIYKRRQQITERQLAELIQRARAAAERSIQQEAIRPLAEFFRINRTGSRHGKRWELFSAADGMRGDHPYREGLKQELLRAHGIYLFYDSRGNAIYAGKARRQNLWNEMTSAFNRNRGPVQKIKRVRHPENRVQYRTSEEKTRQISDAVVPLHELAVYFSAYEVGESMIDGLEALLVRSFANDLLNTRMEHFKRKSALR